MSTPMETGLVHKTGFPDVAGPRISEDLYDALESTSEFTKNPYGVNTNLLAPIQQ